MPAAFGIAGAGDVAAHSPNAISAAAASLDRAPPLAALRSMAAANIFRPSSVPAASAMRGDTASHAARIPGAGSPSAYVYMVQ